MRDAVNILGAIAGAINRLQGHKTVQNDISRKMGELAKFGGGEWSRTTDAADMSRVRIPPTNWKQ